MIQVALNLPHSVVDSVVEATLRSSLEMVEQDIKRLEAKKKDEGLLKPHVAKDLESDKKIRKALKKVFWYYTGMKYTERGPSPRGSQG